jgi:hypothetical protein
MRVLVRRLGKPVTTAANAQAPIMVGLKPFRARSAGSMPGLLLGGPCCFPQN